VHPKLAARAGAEPHAAQEGALEDREPAVGPEPDQKELAGLVGGEGEAGASPGEPGGEEARAGQLKPGSIIHSRLQRTGTIQAPKGSSGKSPKRDERASKDGTYVIRLPLLVRTPTNMYARMVHGCAGAASAGAPIARS